MRSLIFIIVTLTLSNVAFGQKLIEELSDFYPPELIIENNIHEVITEVKNTPKNKFTFNKLGQLVSNTEYKNWATGDTTIRYYTYINNLKTQIVHVDIATGDTLSYDNYIYADEVLIGKEGIQSTNNTKTSFQYYDNGNLKESLFVMTFSSGNDTSRVDHKFYDESGRIVRFERIPYSGITETTRFTYAESSVESEKENNENGEFYPSERVLFNENLQITNIIKYRHGTEEIQSTIELIYLDEELLDEMTMDGNSIVKFTYSYY